MDSSLISRKEALNKFKALLATVKRELSVPDEQLWN